MYNAGDASVKIKHVTLGFLIFFVASALNESSVLVQCLLRGYACHDKCVMTMDSVMALQRRKEKQS